MSINLIFSPKQELYGCVINSKTVKYGAYNEKSEQFRRINFDNDFSLLDNPDKLKKKRYYDKDYNVISFVVKVIETNSNVLINVHHDDIDDATARVKEIKKKIEKGYITNDLDSIFIDVVRS